MYVSDSELGLLWFSTIQFFVSISCYLHDSCCFKCGDLLYIDLTLRFVWGRCNLYILLYTNSSRYHMYKTCALWWGGAGPCWIWIPEPHIPPFMSLFMQLHCVFTAFLLCWVWALKPPCICVFEPVHSPAISPYPPFVTYFSGSHT